MTRHKDRPPSDLPLGLKLDILLIYPLCSQGTLEVEDVLVVASTKRNLSISVCQVHILQSLRGHRGWPVTISLQNKGPVMRWKERVRN